ncbi:MAG: LysM peptidoglycan-binding domain-containing protein [Bacteroidetes bacterium]|nr:MAG: LysM peptidoglycan-binding domain-containing protein [Bacteroidota bacterium]
MVFRHWIFLFSFLAASFQLSAQFGVHKPNSKDSLDAGTPFAKTVEQSLKAFLDDYAKDPNYDSIQKALKLEKDEIPEFTDSQLCAQLSEMNELSPFHLDCNESTLSVIRFFAHKRRHFIRIALGRSKLYFDLYEEMLDKYDLPLELKYLSVIESGLRPQVKSRAGALGLWQFMYRTGKMYGLNENSYYDERMDPIKATDAACRYLKKLHDIYGDWNLALAAYNAGPGNVNKAIRRSGGKTSYWEIRPFLPRETQGYVPNFIAASYLMTYHKENNLLPMSPKVHRAQLDTICLKEGVHMESIEKLVSWPLEDIKSFNPIYKRTYIPKTKPSQCLTGPLQKIGRLVALEDSLIALEKKLYGEGVSLIAEKESPSNGVQYHRIKKGETIHLIASKYSVTTQDIMKWNHLRSARLVAGKTLKIYPPDPPKTKARPDSIMGTIHYDSLVEIEHVVKKNESIQIISRVYNVSVDSVRKWNGLKDNWINIDQKLKIKTVVKLSKEGMIPNPAPVEEIKPAPTKTVAKPATGKKYYTVRSGDLFNRIALRHNLSPAQLRKLNPSVNPDRIRVGQRIRVR